MKKNRSYFVGVGAYNGKCVLMDSNRDSNGFLNHVNEQHSQLKLLCCLMTDTIGVFYGDNGIYIEQAYIFPEENVNIETLRSCYTKEECFYQAEIVSEEVVCEADAKALYQYIKEEIKNLNKYDGFTLRIKEGYVYRLNTIEGILI